MKQLRTAVVAPFLLGVSLGGLFVGAPGVMARGWRVGPGPLTDFPRIQQALDAAADGDSIVVEPGVYELAAPLEFNRRHDSSDPASPPRKNLSLRPLRPQEETVLRVASNAPSTRSAAFLFSKGESSASLVSGFTIEAGSGYSVFEDGRWRSLGAGVVCVDSSPRFDNCRIRPSSELPTVRTLVWLERSNARFVGCSLEGGQPLAVDGGAPRFDDCRFADGIGAGGAAVADSRATFARCRFEDNGDQSGLHISNASEVTLVDCVLRHNDGEPGGGFLARGESAVTLLGCTIEGNGADDGGGGFAVVGATATLMSCRIVGNFGDQGGGAFSCVNAAVRLENCLVAGNHGEDSGGAFVAVTSAVSSTPATVEIIHSTLSGNAQQRGGAVMHAMGDGTSITLHASIVYGNDGDAVELLDGATLSASFSCVEGVAPLPGRGNVNADPLFIEPGVFDFSSLDYRPDFVVSPGDYGLREGSPCIDLAPSAAAPAIDLAGAARPCAEAADAGAFEAGGCAPERFLRGDVDGNGFRDVSDQIAVLNFLFLGLGAPGCLDSADTDDNGRIEIDDPIRGLRFLFLGGPRPAEPFEECGPDRTADELDCADFFGCF